MSPRTRTLTLSAALVVSPAVLGRVPQRWRPLVSAGASTLLAAAAGTRLGLRPPQLPAGVRTGGVAAALIALVVGGSPLLTPVRASMRDRQIELGTVSWLGLHIPIGTVWSEELAFRGVLLPLAQRAFGPRTGALVQAAVFGLAHIRPARNAGDPVLGTVLATALAGWVFGALRARSDSVAASMLAHLALNETGAVAALAVQRNQRISANGEPGASAPWIIER